MNLLSSNVWVHTPGPVTPPDGHDRGHLGYWTRSSLGDVGKREVGVLIVVRLFRVQRVCDRGGLDKCPRTGGGRVEGWYVRKRQTQRRTREREV